MSAEDQDALLAAMESETKDAEIESDSGPVSAPDAAMLGYVSKLTRTPEAIECDDVDALRAQGFDDRAIHDICAVASYYAFVNRIAGGLGVELEERS